MTRARSSRRRDSITVREVARRKYEVDFAVKIGGKPYRFRRVSPFATVEKSLAWARRERDALLEHGGRPPKQAPRVDPAAPRTFAYWAKRYLDDATNPARRFGANDENTVMNKERILRVHLVPVFGSTPVTEIGDAELEAFVRAKVKTHAERHVGIMLGYAKAVLRQAKRLGCPAERNLTISELALRPTPKGEDDIPPTLSEAETATLLAEIDDADAHLFAVAMFRAGLRPGEALALRWSDIDLEHGFLVVARRFNRKTTKLFGLPKGRKVRTVPLHPELHAVLSERKRDRPGQPHELLLESARTPGRPPVPATLVERIRPVVERVGLVGPDGEPFHFTAKVGRHSLGRHWAERGFPLVGLQRILGHKDIQTTQVYAHWSRAASGDLLSQIGVREPSLADRVKRASANELHEVRALLDELLGD